MSGFEVPPAHPKRDEPESLGGDQGIVGRAARVGNPPPIALDARRLAAALGISPRHLETLLTSGRLPRPIRLGRRRVWPIDEVRSWLASGAPPQERWETMGAGGRHE